MFQQKSVLIKNRVSKGYNEEVSAYNNKESACN